MNMLAIVDGRPETLGLRELLKAHVDFLYQVTTRKYENLLTKEKNRREIQEGLIKACNVIDLIIEILRGSRDRAMAKACLVEGKTDGIRFRSKESRVMASQLAFTENQANAILEMRLYKLIGLELEALIREHEETLSNIYRYEDILERRESMAQVIRNELDEIKRKFSVPRKTVIDNCAEAVFEEKKPEETDVMFLMDRFGYARTIDMTVYERNKEAADAENRFVFSCRNTGRICLFTNTGQLYTVKVSDLPYGKFRDKGTPVDNVSNYDSAKEELLNVCSQSELNLCRVIFTTKMGMIKVVDGGEFDVMKRTVAATRLQDGDELKDVTVLREQQTVTLQTHKGFFLRFAIEEIPEKKKAAIGVRAIRLSPDDFVEAVHFTGPGGEGSISVGDRQLELSRLKIAKRDGKGTKVRI